MSTPVATADPLSYVEAARPPLGAYVLARLLLLPGRRRDVLAADYTAPAADHVGQPRVLARARAEPNFLRRFETMDDHFIHIVGFDGQIQIGNDDAEKVRAWLTGARSGSNSYLVVQRGQERLLIQMSMISVLKSRVQGTTTWSVARQ
jgi:hypothetical protein